MRTSKLWRLAICAALSTLCSSRLEAEDLKLTPSDILNTRWASSVCISADGTRVAYLIHEPSNAGDPRSGRTTTLWIYTSGALAKPVQVGHGHFDISDPRWSPDGRAVTFLSADDDGLTETQIWECRVDSLLCRQLTDESYGVLDYCWSDDGSKIAFSTPVNRVISDDPVVVDQHRTRHRLKILKPENHETTEVTSDEQHVVDFQWSPDGNRFAAVLAPSTNKDERFENSHLVVLSQSGEVLQTLNRSVADRRGLAWSPDGRQVVFMELAPLHFAFRMAIADLASGNISYPLHKLAATPQSGRSAFVWEDDSRHLLVHTFEHTRNQLCRVDTRTGKFKRVAESIHNFWSYGISKDGETMVFAADQLQSPTDVVLMRKGGKPEQITDLNPQLAAFGLGDQREVTWENSIDGRTIYGVLTTPAGYQAGKAYPTVVLLHGGPQSMWWNSWLGTHLSWGQLLASNGYVVFHPNPRGSTGQGWQFVEAIHKDWGGLDCQDVLDGVDMLVEAGIADPDRLGIGGWSYGGFLTASATTQTNRFKAAIVGAGITDLLTYEMTVDWVGWVHRYLGGSGLDHRQRYIRLSPFAHVSDCSTPTLVLHGEKDQRCPIDQGRAWYRGLRAVGVESEMVVYPRAGHVVTDRAHEIDLQQRVVDWFDRHLKSD